MANAIRMTSARVMQSKLKQSLVQLRELQAKPPQHPQSEHQQLIQTLWDNTLTYSLFVDESVKSHDRSETPRIKRMSANVMEHCKLIDEAHKEAFSDTLETSENHK